MNKKPKRQQSVAFSFVTMPKRIRENEEAYKCWIDLLPILVENKTIHKEDMKLFESLCLTWSNYVKAEQDVLTHGALQITNSGYQQVSAHFTLATKYLEIFNKICNSFGLNPASRSRIGIKPEEDEDSDDGNIKRFFK